VNAPASLSPGKEPMILDRELVESQNWSGCGGKEKIKFMPLSGIKPWSSSL